MAVKPAATLSSNLGLPKAVICSTFGVQSMTTSQMPEVINHAQSNNTLSFISQQKLLPLCDKLTQTRPCRIQYHNHQAGSKAAALHQTKIKLQK